MSAMMILFHDPTSRNGTRSPKSMLSGPIKVVLDSIDVIDTFCSAIRENRNLGPSTPALDSLESFLEDSRRRILANVKFLHEKYGGSLDNHSDSAISLLLDCSKSMQVELIPKLRRIALRQNTQYAGRMENPHFDDIMDEFKGLDNHIYDSFRSINRRMGGDDSDLRSAPKSSSLLQGGSRTEKKFGLGEVAVDSKLHDELLKLAENCWVEQVIQGRLVWVNVADSEKVRQQRPENAFIKELEKDSPIPNGLQPFAQLGLGQTGLGRNNNNGGGVLNPTGRLFLNYRGPHFHYPSPNNWGP